MHREKQIIRSLCVGCELIFSSMSKDSYLVNFQNGLECEIEVEPGEPAPYEVFQTYRLQTSFTILNKVEK